jgi:hypothetical protein
MHKDLRQGVSYFTGYLFAISPDRIPFGRFLGRYPPRRVILTCQERSPQADIAPAGNCAHKPLGRHSVPSHGLRNLSQPTRGSRLRNPLLCAKIVQKSIPERAPGVKGLLADFWAHRPRRSPIGLLADGLGSVEESSLELGCRGHVQRGCSRRSFLRRRHPYPSLRESTCRKRQSVRPTGTT